MASHHHQDSPWRVRVDDARGVSRGAGVLLDDRHVLTCAHVVAVAGGESGELRVAGVACGRDWTRAARVAPGSWVPKDSRRGDVALLELAEPTGCGLTTTLWKVPVSGGRVRAYGFPGAEPYYGIAAEAQLLGSGGRSGEWVQLRRISTGDPWIEEGYSGAGVLAVDGEFAGKVIGIVVADFTDGPARAAWMLPTATVVSYLPGIAVGGEDILPEPGPSRAAEDRDDPPAPALPADVLTDPLRLALTQELTRLLDGGWSGTAVVSTDATTGAGDSWLVRLVRTADPAARAGVTDAELTDAPKDTVLGLGAVDAAYDAGGRTTADVRGHLARRFGLLADTDRQLVSQLLRRTPPACAVIGRVDRAADPAGLVGDLLGPLARSARTRGLRLVLGFEDRPPDGLPYDVHLDPGPLRAVAPRAVEPAQADAAVADLAAAEEDAARLRQEHADRYFAPPRLPAPLAPALRVRLAVARTTGGPESAAVLDRAEHARAAVDRYRADVRHMSRIHQELTVRLRLHRALAVRHFGAEDRVLGEPYTRAARALRTVPVDLRTARDLVRHYADEVDRRIDESGPPLEDRPTDGG